MGEVTRVVDVDEERLLRHFCLEEQCTEVIQWFEKQNFSRPDGFSERLELATRVKETANAELKKQDFMAAMMYTLGALYCLDFSQARTVLQTAADKRQVNEALVPLLSNLSFIFLKRGDAYNAARAADLGLDYAKRTYPDNGSDDTSPGKELRAKLLFRRGLAKGQSRDFEPALADLREAARLKPFEKDIRKALENCKVAVKQERGAPDDKWRGLLSEAPEKAQRVARYRRCWRYTRALSAEVVSCIVDPVNRKVTVMLFSGLFMSMMLPAVLAWYTGTERSGWFGIR